MKSANCAHEIGFTLIELLVVVLIIGVLASVALSQYNKVVWRARNTELKQLVKSVAQAEQAYYLATGAYAANFDELSLDLPLTRVPTQKGGMTGVCNTTVQGTDASRAGEDFYVALNSGSDAMPFVSIVAHWNQGPYKCAGFGVNLNYETLHDSVTQLHCREMAKTQFYTGAPGAFCEKVEKGTLVDQDRSWRFYSVP